jgi:hypothetical protein
MDESRCEVCGRPMSGRPPRCAVYHPPDFGDRVGKAASQPRRITKPEDVAPALAEVMAAAEADDGLMLGDVAILRALHAHAVELDPPSIEVAATRDWLEDELGLGERAVRNGLRRLGTLGYLQRITLREVRMKSLQVWLARRRRTGSPPMLVRLATLPPRPSPAPRSGRPPVEQPSPATMRKRRQRAGRDLSGPEPGPEPGPQ